ncbi:MAG: hypothetical protein GY821_14995 [Gammaproteobacteria bacterium]|nr:hypothetical protein [Gammaproteobacteria bacterium]
MAGRKKTAASKRLAEGKKVKLLQGKHRYCCQETACRRTFILDYKNRGCLPGIKEQIVDMCINRYGRASPTRRENNANQQPSKTSTMDNDYRH